MVRISITIYSFEPLETEIVYFPNHISADSPKTWFWSECKHGVFHLHLTNGKNRIVIVTNCIVSWLFSA